MKLLALVPAAISAPPADFTPIFLHPRNRSNNYMRFLVLFAFAASAFAQTADFVASSGTVTLSTAATKVTIQQPASNPEQIQLKKAVVRCPAACTITQTQNATTPATATAGTVAGLIPFQNTAFAVTFWTGSNASGGVTVGVVTLDAAGTVEFDLTGRSLGYGTTSNYSIAISAVTGDARIDIYGSRL